MSSPKPEESEPPKVDTELVLAAAADQERDLLRMLEDKHDANSVDEGGVSALCAAAVHGHVRSARMLLRHGADPDQAHIDTKRTAMHMAAKEGKVNMVELLHRYKADASLKDIAGRTALHWACLSDQPDCVRKLISYGAPLNEPDHSGYTPLITAVEYNRIDCVSMLIKHGADVNICNNLKHSALEIADWYGLKPILNLLTAHISKLAEAGTALSDAAVASGARAVTAASATGGGGGGAGAKAGEDAAAKAKADTDKPAGDVDMKGGAS
mmetsp:Transcript_46339/g.129175  ORF Transcript_46339/g.129175 Transcript_46339/m.129175 type:complete len:269 (-) Transcript_46339:95-901(-)